MSVRCSHCNDFCGGGCLHYQPEPVQRAVALVETLVYCPSCHTVYLGHRFVDNCANERCDQHGTGAGTRLLRLKDFPVDA